MPADLTLHRAAVGVVKGRSIAKKTLKRYTGEWGYFTTWCGELAIDPLRVDADTVAAYIATLTHQADGSRKLTVAAIDYFYRDASLPSPTTRARAFNRAFLRLVGKKGEPIPIAAMDPDLVAEIVRGIERPPRLDDPAWFYDTVRRLMIGVGGVWGRRIGDLNRAVCGSFRADPTGVSFTVPFAKHDQTGRAETLHFGHLTAAPPGSPYCDRSCVACALYLWDAAMTRAWGPDPLRPLFPRSADEDGPVGVLDTDDVTLAIQRFTRGLGARFTARSLRKMVATILHDMGRSLEVIADHLGHQGTWNTPIYIVVDTSDMLGLPTATVEADGEPYRPWLDLPWSPVANPSDECLYIGGVRDSGTPGECDRQHRSSPCDGCLS